METLKLKEAIKELREDIKVKAEKQIFYKNQRKTKRLVGERKMFPGMAAWNHQDNRSQLRIMYSALAILRGKEITYADSLKFENEWERNSFVSDVHQLVRLYEEVNE